jgi:hypothetical protein
MVSHGHTIKPTENATIPDIKPRLKRGTKARSKSFAVGPSEIARNMMTKVAVIHKAIGK